LNVRPELEKKSGRKDVTNENYLALTQAAKKVKRIKTKPKKINDYGNMGLQDI
jgi:hypothetical protein